MTLADPLRSAMARISASAAGSTAASAGAVDARTKALAPMIARKAEVMRLLFRNRAPVAPGRPDHVVEDDVGILGQSWGSANVATPQFAFVYEL
jgi:hypothetical protein